MKKLILILPLLVVCSFQSYGQLPERGHMPSEIIVVEKQPLILLGHYETKAGSLLIDQQNLEVVKEYDSPTAIGMYGKKGKDGVVVAKVSENTALFRLKEVLDYFEVPAAKRSLTVLVNNSVVDPALFLADLKQIEKIEVTKQDITNFERLSLDLDEEFLNIVTRK